MQHNIPVEDEVFGLLRTHMLPLPVPAYTGSSEANWPAPLEARGLSWTGRGVGANRGATH